MVEDIHELLLDHGEDVPETFEEFFAENYDLYSEILIDRYTKIMNMQCNFQDDAFALQGAPHEKNFAFVQYSVKPCSGTDCETDPALIAEYF